MTNSQYNDRETAQRKLLTALHRVGLSDSHVCHAERCAINVFGNNKGSVNVDFAVQGGTIIKICMYIHRGSLASNIQADLVSVGNKYKNWALEPGNQGLQRIKNGVLYKLNTHVNWTNLTPGDVTSIANNVKDFVCDASRVLN